MSGIIVCQYPEGQISSYYYYDDNKESYYRLDDKNTVVMIRLNTTIRQIKANIPVDRSVIAKVYRKLCDWAEEKYSASKLTDIPDVDVDEFIQKINELVEKHAKEAKMVNGIHNVLCENIKKSRIDSKSSCDLTTLVLNTLDQNDEQIYFLMRYYLEHQFPNEFTSKRSEEDYYLKVEITAEDIFHPSFYRGDILAAGLRVLKSMDKPNTIEATLTQPKGLCKTSYRFEEKVISTLRAHGIMIPSAYIFKVID